MRSRNERARPASRPQPRIRLGPCGAAPAIMRPIVAAPGWFEPASPCVADRSRFRRNGIRAQARRTGIPRRRGQAARSGAPSGSTAEPTERRLATPPTLSASALALIQKRRSVASPPPGRVGVRRALICWRIALPQCRAGRGPSMTLHSTAPGRLVPADTDRRARGVAHLDGRRGDDVPDTPQRAEACG